MCLEHISSFPISSLIWLRPVYGIIFDRFHLTKLIEFQKLESSTWECALSDQAGSLTESNSSQTIFTHAVSFQKTKNLREKFLIIEFATSGVMWYYISTFPHSNRI